MGLIYVNPEGRGGNPSALAAGRDIRETFARMATNDEETVALIVGGHTFGKTHGAPRRARRTSVRNPKARLSRRRASAEEQVRRRQGSRPDHSGLEGAWTNNPTKWDNGFLENLVKYDWDLVTSPAGE